MASELLKQAQKRTLRRAGDADHDPAETAKLASAVPVPTQTEPADIGSAPAVPSVRQAPIEPQRAGGSFNAPIDKVSPNPLNTRDINTRPDKLASLRASLAELGQMEPSACVSRHAFLAVFGEHSRAIGDAEWVQVSGGRRRSALLLDGEATIEITVKDGLAASRAGFITATAEENLQRADLDLVEEARVVEQLLAELGSGNAVAEQLKRAPGWVSQRKGILLLIPEVQDQLRADNELVKLPLRDVRDWHSLSREQQLANLAAWRRRRGLDPSQPGPNPTVLPKPTLSRVQKAIQRLGDSPVAIAATLRSELTAEQRRELAEELRRD